MAARLTRRNTLHDDIVDVIRAPSEAVDKVISESVGEVTYLGIADIVAGEVRGALGSRLLEAVQTLSGSQRSMRW